MVADRCPACGADVETPGLCPACQPLGATGVPELFVVPAPDDGAAQRALPPPPPSLPEAAAATVANPLSASRIPWDSTVDPIRRTLAVPPPASPSRASAAAPSSAETAIEPDEDDLAPGTLVDQRYEIAGVLGRGGMGVVYRARELALSRDVALKVVGLLGAEGRRRFQREAVMASAFRHPGAVQIYGVGEHKGRPYIAMEMVPGVALHDLMEGGATDLRAFVALIAKVARTLDAAHEAGIVHRDVKPQNILVDPTGEPRLTDFGLAKREDESERLTQMGTILGTPYYMSPEQIERASEADRRSDVYSLGAILYEFLAGRPPFEGTRVSEILLKMMRAEVIPPSSGGRPVPKDLETVCLKAIALVPEDRYATAADLARDLDRFLAGEAVTARPESLFRRTARRLARVHPAVVAVLAVLLTLGVVGAYVASHQTRRSEAVRLLDEARNRRRLRNDISALAFLDQAIERAPDLLEARTERASVLTGLGRYEEALADLDRVIAATPDDLAALASHYSVLMELGRYEDAIRDMDRYIQLDPRSYVGFNNRGWAALEMDRPQQAFRDLEQAARMAPDQAHPQASLAFFYIRWAGEGPEKEGNLARAEELCRRALELDPRSAGARHQLGLIAHKRGRHADAIAEYDAALVLYPDLGEAYYNRAVCRRETHDLAGATQDLRTYIRLRPREARGYVEMAEVSKEAGDLTAAREVLRQGAEAATDPRERERIDRALAELGPEAPVPP